MKKSVLLFLLALCNTWLLQAQSEGQIRMEYQTESIVPETISFPLDFVKEEVKSQNIIKVDAKKVKISKINTKKAAYTENRAFLRNLKSPLKLDSLPPQRSTLQRLGCFLREPLDLITLGVEMFELTKPPKSPFLVILYVIYIVPLFAIITSFIIGGILGLVSFILACGLFAFLLYWLTLALLGIVLAGNLILWGIIGAFVFGLILYLMLIRLC